MKFFFLVSMTSETIPTLSVAKELLELYSTVFLKITFTSVIRTPFAVFKALPQFIHNCPPVIARPKEHRHWTFVQSFCGKREDTRHRKLVTSQSLAINHANNLTRHLQTLLLNLL